MARSRIGGSSGLLSGKVGNVIYSITRNADGSFRQQLGKNPESRINPNTDAQARARMTMGLIERAMFTYVDFMGTGFEGIDIGTNSVSRFSELNYNAIKYEIEEYWNMEDWPDWSYEFPRKRETSPKDGCFIISRGSLQWEGFIFCQPATASRRYFSVETTSLREGLTLRQFLGLNDLRIGMQFVGIFYCQGTTPSKSFVAWIMFYTDPNVRANDVLTSSNWRNYIRVKSNVPLNAYYVEKNSQLILRCEALDDYKILRTGCTGRRVRIRENNRYLYNNCDMVYNVFPSPQEAWGWKTLWDVKKSWLEK